VKTVACIGMDPGRSTGLAAVAWSDEGPRLLGLHSVYGSNRRTWLGRAGAATADLHSKVFGLQGEGLVAAYVEEIPATMRMGSIRGVTRGHKAWAGLGQWRGLGLGALITAEVEVTDIDQTVWVGAVRSSLGRIAESKNEGDPLLRVREASNLIRGAREALVELGAPPGWQPGDKLTAGEERSIDAAEAILIAAAGCILMRHAAAGRATTPKASRRKPRRLHARRTRGR